LISDHLGPTAEGTRQNVDGDRSSQLNQEICCFARSTADNDAPRRDDDPVRRNDRMSDTACDAAGMVHTGSANDGACFHSAQGGEAS
jgi:hypothetical protein